MKKFIITITLLIALVGSVFAKPKVALTVTDVDGYSSTVWDTSFDVKWTTYEKPYFEFLEEQIADFTKVVITKADVSEMPEDLVFLLNEYGYTIHYENGYLSMIDYLVENTVWTILF